MLVMIGFCRKRFLKMGRFEMTIKIIGAGFGRTGTASLKMALETLLQAPCYHMSEVLGNSGHVDMWLEAAAGNPDWKTVFAGYEATVDCPGSHYWRELAEAYPEAKVILSVRDAERWFAWTQDTIFSKTMQDLSGGTKWGRMMAATITDHMGGDLNDKDALVAAFNDHTARLKAAFGPERLLVFEAKEGWAPLCKFLGLPEPEGECRHINSKAEFEAVFGLLRSPIGPSVMSGEGIQSETVHEDLFKAD